MKILIIVTDLYLATGGGETAYRKIIEANPNLHFYYFRDKEKTDQLRPANAFGIPLRLSRKVRIRGKQQKEDINSFLQEANRYARSVAGLSFDIADSPDYIAFGNLLRAAMYHHKVKIKRYVLALHGRVSYSIAMNWGVDEERLQKIRQLEKQQLETVDAIYGFSRKYIRETTVMTNKPITYIDPGGLIETARRRKLIPSTGERPGLYCIGRTEKLKGNDIFIDIVSRIDAKSYSEAVHIGNADFSYRGKTSLELLAEISAQKGVAFIQKPAFQFAKLKQLYSQRSVIVVPSRFETLNLLSLEAIFSGCLVAISNRAGACEYLDDRYAGIPYVKIDIDKPQQAAEMIQEVLDRYDVQKQKLMHYLDDHKMRGNVLHEIKAFYASTLSGEDMTNENVSIQYSERRLALKPFLYNIYCRFAAPLKTFRK